ncbi:MAG: helix-turn-helix domain-containing protein, partial [Clostridia bacterium]|nr:helix-turn-helix domain-containing protein [Clostridia bacterium]
NSTVLLSADRIITHVWGWEANVDMSVVYVHISNIRKKLEQIGSAVTVKFARNVGYVLEERNNC